MVVKKIPSVLTRAMRKQYPNKIPETPFMRILGKLRWAGRDLPVGTKVPRVVIVGGSIVGQWVGVDVMTENLVIGAKSGQVYDLKDDPLRIEISMKELSGKGLQEAKAEIIQAIEIAQQNPGAGGVESFYHDHGDPPFSPFSGLSCDKGIIKNELDKLIKILREERLR